MYSDTEPILSAYYDQKKFKSGELKNAVLSVAATFKPAEDADVKLKLRRVNEEDRVIEDVKEPNLKELHELTKLAESPYGFILELGRVQLFFGYVQKVLQLHIYHTDPGTAQAMRVLFEVTADLNPKWNTCFWCGKSDPDSHSTLTMKKTLERQVTYTGIMQNVHEKKIKVPRCRRCAAITTLFEIAFALLIGGGIFLSMPFWENALHLIVFIVLYLGLGALAYLLLSRLLHYKYRSLRGHPECKAMQEEYWTF
jgi:hypothetical protein